MIVTHGQNAGSGNFRSFCRGLALSAVLPAAIIPMSAHAVDTQVLTPFEDGNSWTYRIESAPEAGLVGKTWTLTVVGDASFNGQQTKQTEVTGLELLEEGLLGQYLSVGAAGSRTHGATINVDGGEGTLVYTPPRTNLPATLESGSPVSFDTALELTINAEGQTGEFLSSITDTITLLRQESVTVPAGTFNAYVVRTDSATTATRICAEGQCFSVPVPVDDVATSSTVWYAPNVGVVKSDADGEVSVLVSYSTGGQGGGMGGSPGDEGFDPVTVLEEPANGEVYSGIGNLRGFALAEGGIARVEVWIDGEYVFDAPYGGYREDVGQVFSAIDGSENSGFSLAFGYTNLTPGAHTITIRAVATDATVKEATATFFVDNFHKPFIFQGDTVNISGGSVSLDQTGIDLSDVLIDGQRYDLRLEWTTATQGFEIKSIERR